MEGLVLKRINFEENSYILTVLTKEKYMSLINKGAKKKNSLKLAISEPISLIDFQCTKSKTMPSLTEGVVIDDYCYLKNDLVKLSLASVIVEYLYLLKDVDCYTDKLFDLGIISLKEINIDQEIALFRFESLLIKELGSSLKEEYLKENYEYYLELKSELINLFNNKNIENKEILRRFFIDYFKTELGITVKSKKMYLEMI